MRYDINPYCSRAVGTYRTEGISRTRYISQIRQDLYRGAFAPYFPLAIYQASHFISAIVTPFSPSPNVPNRKVLILGSDFKY